MSSKLQAHLFDPNTFFVERTNKKVTLVYLNPRNKTAIIEELKCKKLEQAEGIQDFFETQMWKKQSMLEV